MNAKRLTSQCSYVCLTAVALAWIPAAASAKDPILTGRDSSGYYPGRPETGSADLSKDLAPSDPWKTGMQPHDTPMLPAAVALTLGVADSIEEGAKGADLARSELGKGLLGSGPDVGKARLGMTGVTGRIASKGEWLGVPDKAGDYASVLGAASNAFYLDEHGEPHFDANRIDGIGVSQELANNYLSGLAVYYGAKGGAVAGAQLGALSGNPAGVVIGGLVGGLLGSVTASLAYEGTGKKAVEAWADAASARRGTEYLVAMLARCQTRLQEARMHLQDADFDEAVQLANEVQGIISSNMLAMRAAGLEPQARQLNFAALEILGRVARLRLEANSKPSQPAAPTPELRAAPPHAASQIFVKGTWTAPEQPNGRDPRTAEVSAMIDLANQKFYGEANGKWLPGRDGQLIFYTFHLEFHGTYTGDEQSGIFEGTGNLTAFAYKAGKTYAHPLCTIRGKLANGRVTGTCSNAKGTDYFDLPAR